MASIPAPAPTPAAHSHGAAFGRTFPTAGAAAGAGRSTAAGARAASRPSSDDAPAGQVPVDPLAGAKVMDRRARVQLELGILKLQQSLYPPAATAVLPPHLKGCCRCFTPELYLEVVEERASHRLCGYPLCNKPLVATKRGLLRVSRTTLTIFSPDDIYHFCSLPCRKASAFLRGQISKQPVYLRARNPRLYDVKLLHELPAAAAGCGVAAGGTLDVRDLRAALPPAAPPVSQAPAPGGMGVGAAAVQASGSPFGTAVGTVAPILARRAAAAARGAGASSARPRPPASAPCTPGVVSHPPRRSDSASRHSTAPSASGAPTPPTPPAPGTYPVADVVMERRGLQPSG